MKKSINVLVPVVKKMKKWISIIVLSKLQKCDKEEAESRERRGIGEREDELPRLKKEKILKDYSQQPAKKNFTQKELQTGKKQPSSQKSSSKRPL